MKTPEDAMNQQSDTETGRRRLGWGASILFLLLLAALVGVAYGAYRTGTTLRPAATGSDSLAERLFPEIKQADGRISDAAATTIAEQVRALVMARLAPITDRSPNRVEIDSIALASQEAAAGELASAQPESARWRDRAVVVQRLRDRIGTLLRADPVLVPRQVNIVGWWAGASAVLVLIAMMIGYGFRGSLIGALTDSRNRLSLARCQLLGWSVLIFGMFLATSGFLIGTTGGLELPNYNWHIWALLGVSIGTPPVSGLILVGKTQQQPDPKTQTLIAAQPGISNRGLIATKPEGEWSILDLFRGEEVANVNEIDISRFQHFVITITLMIVFVGATAELLWDIGIPGDGWTIWAGKGTAPPLSDTFIGLLGISHATYLGLKALPKANLATGHK